MTEPTTNSLPPLTLVLGGARSGKSRYAEGLLADWSGTRIYLATAEAGDAEMQARIRHHRERRGEAWMTVEEPLELAAALVREAQGGRAVLVDCLTLWLSNITLAERDIEAEAAALIAALGRCAGPIVLVSNEVGQGIVPENPLARRFRDDAGRLHQEVARVADRVVLVTAGLAQILK
ncbi:MAG TPA: bifunctional adenosylcobinamide kinase/adenosylcobinamide-phosphate guanylyltransferase [Alphaproteobacteria bacterium]|jgi:adenosylcobinamide kinase/adenosylcobinamide-phosphate guanylyltransferase|nr:bifunctional adenosylcobinamide kinase/adenosylcobinamide-phosphate guanylyltransferase [Alphaproteobacteria bacterium]MDP7428232.1 bifunctional adenosylcobinamide kinase/adenosylcobinamide-phosphate guanylyltransferase [Alphaproteobacteria bacterium]HJM48261.1 bifunctional adenosylcobinamide kinase/adenosylcobinamide-phosphate guanylyltransferase [Alphaproteobacteria bacterium]